MMQQLEKAAVDIKAEKEESERYNDQDNYVKYAKMQRSIVKLEKILKTGKEELAEKQSNLRLSDREMLRDIL